MIVSHKYKFIYLKGHKVAGSSVLLALGRHCDEGDSVFLPAKGNPPEDVWADDDWTSSRNLIGLQRESTPDNVRNKIGDTMWDEYTKVTIVRNPWDLAVSSFFWALRKKKNLENENYKIYFNDWIKHKKSWKDMKQNISRSVDSNGNLLMDYYIKYENLQQSYMQFCEKVGIESMRLPRLKSNIRSARSNKTYEYFYTKESRDLVQKKVGRYIETFGYEFGEL
mgnify:FL=1